MTKDETKAGVSPAQAREKERRALQAASLTLARCRSTIYLNIESTRDERVREIDNVQNVILAALAASPGIAEKKERETVRSEPYEYDCEGDDWLEPELRGICERLYQLGERVAPSPDAHSQAHFDAGYIAAARELLEGGYVCDRHRREDGERRCNERLLKALNARQGDVAQTGEPQPFKLQDAASNAVVPTTPAPGNATPSEKERDE